MNKKIEIKFRRIDKLDRDFTQISNNVFYLLKGKATAYMVYSYLNHRYNTNVNCAFPSIKTPKNSRKKVDGKNQKSVRGKSFGNTAYPF
ncbi:hypothetical protein ACQVQF_09945 [Bacillus cereus]